MKIYKEETPDGTLESITFRADGEENFKDAVKAWIRENCPQMDWEEFVNRLQVMEAGRVIISMT